MMNIAPLLAYCIRNYMRTCYVFAALALSGLSFNVQASKVIDVWTYYSSPPFSLSSDQHSLTQVLFRELSSRSEGRWTFKVSYLPRKRINLNLGKDRQGIVVWTNPLWFNDKEESKYSWTNRVVWGRNEIVSLKGTPVEYEGAKSLIGKRFGGVLGHHYVEIDPRTQ